VRKLLRLLEPLLPPSVVEANDLCSANNRAVLVSALPLLSDHDLALTVAMEYLSCKPSSPDFPSTRARHHAHEVIAKFKAIQMVDVHLPTTDGREIVLSRYTQPEADHRMLLDLLRLNLPEQPPPRITAKPDCVAVETLSAYWRPSISPIGKSVT